MVIGSISGKVKCQSHCAHSHFLSFPAQLNYVKSCHIMTDSSMIKQAVNEGDLPSFRSYLTTFQPPRFNHVACSFNIHRSAIILRQHTPWKWLCRTIDQVLDFLGAIVIAHQIQTTIAALFSETVLHGISYVVYHRPFHLAHFLLQRRSAAIVAEPGSSRPDVRRSPDTTQASGNHHGQPLESSPRLNTYVVI